MLIGKKKFNLSQNNDKSDERIIVLDVEQEIVGLIVDAITEVIHLNKQDINEPPIEMGEEADFIWGIGKYLNRLLILINPQKIPFKKRSK